MLLSRRVLTMSSFYRVFTKKDILLVCDRGLKILFLWTPCTTWTKYRKFILSFINVGRQFLGKDKISLNKSLVSDISQMSPIAQRLLHIEIQKMLSYSTSQLLILHVWFTGLKVIAENVNKLFPQLGRIFTLKLSWNILMAGIICCSSV